eukprot:3123943-Prymnesium_polylepis.1
MYVVKCQRKIHRKFLSNQRARASTPTGKDPHGRLRPRGHTRAGDIMQGCDHAPFATAADSHGPGTSHETTSQAPAS